MFFFPLNNLTCSLVKITTLKFADKVNLENWSQSVLLNFDLIRCLALRADIPVLIRLLKFAMRLLKHLHISLAFIFPVSAQIVLNLLSNHPFLFEK